MIKKLHLFSLVYYIFSSRIRATNRKVDDKTIASTARLTKLPGSVSLYNLDTVAQHLLPSVHRCLYESFAALLVDTLLFLLHVMNSRIDELAAPEDDD